MHFYTVRHWTELNLDLMRICFETEASSYPESSLSQCDFEAKVLSEAWEGKFASQQLEAAVSEYLFLFIY